MTGSQVDRTIPQVGFQYAWPFPKSPPTFAYRVKSYATLLFVRSLTRLLFAGGINKLNVHNRDRFLALLNDRSRPLITVANHRCNIDDPLMWSFLSWSEFFRTISRQRYTLAAHNICFTKQWHTTMFSLGNCVPCVRGEGVFQQGMDFSVEKLNDKGWTHIFPEGKVTPDPIRVKWGVGRLVMDPNISPIVLPIWMKGMDDVWPVKPPYYPRFGKTVEMTIGEPWDSTEFRAEIEKSEYTERQKRKVAADRVQRLLFSLGEESGDVEKGTLERIEKETWRDIKEYK